MGVTVRKSAADPASLTASSGRRAAGVRPGLHRSASARASPSSLWVGGLVLAVLAFALLPLDLLLPKVPVRGVVRDAHTAEPIAGARVRLGPASITSGADGTFSVDRASITGGVLVEADGYRPLRSRVWPLRAQRLGLVPQRFTMHVRDAETGAPIPAPDVGGAGTRARLIAPGQVEVEPARAGTSLTVVADGYRDAIAEYRGEGEIVAALQPRIRGQVVDSTTGQPVRGAHVTQGDLAATTDADGNFELDRRPTGPLRVLAPGYRRAELDASQERTLLAQVEPLQVRALYLTYYGAGDRNLRENVLRLTEQTAVNAVVIDVKGDRGKLAYRSAVPLAEAVGANDAPTITDLKGLLTTLRQRRLYAIARIAVFKDDTLAHHGDDAGLDVAVKHGVSGLPWTDGEGLSWVDPLRPEVWEYNINLAREAVQLGFDEVQFAYARFPIEASGGLSAGQARFSRPWLTERDRVDAIGTFLQRAGEQVRQAGGFVGVDAFGSVAWAEGDNGVGHDLDMLARTVDYLCPTVYPSSFHQGLPGLLTFPQVVQQPYTTVYESVRHLRARTADQAAITRPWLQYFDDYAWQTGRPYRAADIDAQRQGALAAGAAGWMMWDPSNRYTRGGLGARP